MLTPEIGSAQIMQALTTRTLSVAETGLAELDAIRHVAQQFEASFLAEMLKHTGMGEARESFGGGPGEAAFTHMLTEEYAQQMTRTGGVGLADQVYATLRARTEE